METQKNESQKKSWDGEMKELFQELGRQQDLNMSHLKHPYQTTVLLRLPEPRLFRIWDISQKFFFIVNSMLIASPLDFNSPAVWMAVLPNNALDPRHQPIFMGLRDGSLTLSCTLSNEGQPQLHLVKRNIMELYNQNQKFLDFSFYSKTDGSLETCSFESAQFPEQLMAVLPNRYLDKKKTIFMGPENKKSCLSCVKSGNGQYQLELKEKDIEDLYWDPKNAKAFTFYSKSDGNAYTCSFESAEFSGWFLSTSSEAKQPIGLSQKGGPHNVLFHFERKS